ncbi:MAG: hypothetical protein U9M94_00970 [Patescibacteria group bacterium]|nr:hypothetical protein [Patescibacteria group bacterium]
MELTSQQFNKLASKKKLKGLSERVNKKFDMALRNGSVKEYIKELKQKMATKSDIDRFFTAMNNFAKQLEDSKIRFAAQRRASDLKKKILR